MSLEQLIVNASNDPLNPSNNFQIALEYERLGQTAAAVGFYLRSAEYGYETEQLITYSALLRISICIEHQNDRKNTVSNVILQAISYLPERPEAYFLLSKFYEKDKNWQECYTYASVGLMTSKNILQNLPIIVDNYHGSYALDFQMAVSGWWIGRKNESLKILLELSQRQDMSSMYKDAVYDNLRNLGA